MRRVIVFLTVLTMVLVSVPVLADEPVQETGTTYCSSGRTPYVESFSFGSTEHYPPGGGYRSFYNSSDTVSRTYSYYPPGGWWAARVTSGWLGWGEGRCARWS
ncbi:MAG: hypothetical protein OEY55_10485 [Acidimicrobiia bacterium]|nr:hypothetical protein [Acidimicrobiia bacterium]